MNEIIVVRPSGIWNSRTPLNDYHRAISDISRMHAVTAMCSIIARDYLEKLPDQSRSASTFLRKDKHANKKKLDDHARHYLKSFGKSRTQGLTVRTVADLAMDCRLGVEGSVQLATVRINSLIEVYITCWTLNVILAKIESEVPLTDDEISLAAGLNPAETRLPLNLGQILNRYTLLSETLRTVPPYFKHPVSRESSDLVEGDLSAFRMLKFFQHYRNNIIHKNAIASTRFFDSWGIFYNEKIRVYYPHLPEMRRSRPLPMHDDIFGVQAACFYRIATTLNSKLETQSNGRRGSLQISDPASATGIFPSSPQMLKDGDDEISLKWTKDGDFRTSICAARRWRYLY